MPEKISKQNSGAVGSRNAQKFWVNKITVRFALLGICA
jgi:hypothetical protein